MLYGAVAALYPVLCSQPRVCDLFINLLLAICETSERYMAFVKAEAMEKLPAAGDQVLVATAEEMAANGETKTYHPFQYTLRWLDAEILGVVVLDGSEGQRMPIEFVAQRMRTMPDQVIYDFSCVSLKTSLARLPYFALFISWMVDRFHWFKNHVWWRKAMNPDSYVSVDGLNTSASEERNGASRRLQNFLRLVNQRNFILFTVYQPAVGNVIAMHRDVHTPMMVELWPLWHRNKFVDIVDERKAPEVARANKEGGAAEAAGHTQREKEARDAGEGEGAGTAGEGWEADDGGGGEKAEYEEQGEERDDAEVGEFLDDGENEGETEVVGKVAEVDEGGQGGEADSGEERENDREEGG